MTLIGNPRLLLELQRMASQNKQAGDWVAKPSEELARALVLPRGEPSKITPKKPRP